MANALDEDTGEFIELYNNGTADFDLSTLVLWDGDALDTLEGRFDPLDTVLGPGEYAVILDPEYADEYSIPGTALQIIPDDTALGSGLATNDPITLFDSDGIAVVTTYGWPYNAGNGQSISRVDWNAGDDPETWVVGLCLATPGEPNCL